MSDGTSEPSDAGADPRIERPQLRVWATVGEAYTVWFSNPGLWLRLSVVPVLVVIGMLALHTWSWVDAAQAMDQAPVLPAVTALLLVVFMYLAEIPLATAWHRLILQQNSGESHRYVVGRREFRYLLKALFILIVVLLVSLLLGILVSGLMLPLIMGSVGGKAIPENLVLVSIVGSVLSIAIYAVLGYFLGCLFLMLPAAAIGRNFKSGEASTALKGNEWRLVGIYIVALVPIYLLAAAFDGLFSLSLDAPGLGAGLFTYFGPLIFAPLIVGVLSITYRDLVQKPEAVGDTSV
tara:strand:+ start:353 stop:1231 length:879 start_codon:yes stop_codon:yes gene_type:complete